MARLPTVGGDYGNWGTVLNDYLETAHNADGTLKLDVQTIADLKAVDVATLTDKQQALVAGYYAPGDQGGGTFYFDAGASTTDNGGTIIAPDAGAGRWKRIYSGAVNVQWFGAKGDDPSDGTGTDDTAAILAAVATGLPVLFPASGGDGYRITDTITAVSGFNVESGTFIYYNGPADRTALILTTEVNEVSFVSLRSPSTTAWDNPLYKGVVLKNIRSSTVNIREITGAFYSGLVCLGDATGFSLNTVNLGVITICKYAIRLDAINNGYVNDNIFIGGECRCYSSFRSGEDRYGITIESSDGTYKVNNNNIFLKTSVEMHTFGGARTVAVNITDGERNRFEGIRSETNTVEAAFGGASARNFINFGFVSVAAPRVETTSTKLNHVSDEAFRSWNTIFDSGFIPDKTFYYDGDGTTNGVARMFVMSADTESVAHSKVHLAYDVSNLPSYMYTDSGIGVGVKIDTSTQKKFKVSRKFAGAYYGRIVVKVYGSDGVKRPETAGDVLTKAGTVSWTPTYGGAWQQNSDLADDFYFEVGASVDSIALLQGYGSNPPRVTWMSVQTDGAAARVYTPFDYLYAGNSLVATAIPSAGNWRVGQVVRNATPSANGTIGWVCTTAGSPGTWKAFGSIAP